MKQHLVISTFSLMAGLAAFSPMGAGSIAQAGDSWMFRPSYFTHSPVTGERVNQYRPEDPAIATVDPTYQESGYNYQQYDLNVGGSQQHLHIVQTWGLGTQIRPYGEWEYPYRPGATPYGPWLNPRGPWAQPYQTGSNPYGYGRPSWGGGGPTPYGYGMGQFGGGQFPGPQAGIGQGGGGPFMPQVPQPMNPPAQGGAATKLQGPVAF